MVKESWAVRHGTNEECYVGESWPELLQALFVASQSPDAGQREGAFRIFTATPGIIEKQHEDTVLGAFTKGFKDSDVIVRLLNVLHKHPLTM